MMIEPMKFSEVFTKGNVVENIVWELAILLWSTYIIKVWKCDITFPNSGAPQGYKQQA